jgi:hypothetical protein
MCDIVVFALQGFWDVSRHLVGPIREDHSSDDYEFIHSFWDTKAGTRALKRVKQIFHIH